MYIIRSMILNMYAVLAALVMVVCFVLYVFLEITTVKALNKDETILLSCFK